jgi:uncharacterized protein (TIGR00299 family) protein
MRVAYFDAFSGMSGDMTLGALVHLGVPIETVRTVTSALSLSGVELEATRREVNGIQSVKVSVVDRKPGGRERHRSFAEIRSMLAAAPLTAGVRDRAQAIFATLAAAEGRVHGVAADAVQFHEVGAVDSLIDIVGTALALEHLAVDELHVSALPLGRGTVATRHGVLPVPAPATVELLRGWPVRLEDGEAELVTPTGAAIIAALARPGPPPDLRIVGVGYGCGDRVLADRPNVLRVILGEAVVAPGQDEVVCLEANIDDLNPELFEHAMDRLFAAGARDVFLAPIQMKKNRPATLLRVLGDPADRDRLAAIVFQETSTIGIRYSTLRRLTLGREIVHVETRYGTLAVRVALAPDGTPNVAPEYESCRRAADEHGVPLKVVYQAAITAYETGRPRRERG